MSADLACARSLQLMTKRGSTPILTIDLPPYVSDVSNHLLGTEVSGSKRFLRQALLIGNSGPRDVPHVGTGGR